jgi:hypothetical protein
MPPSVSIWLFFCHFRPVGCHFRPRIGHRNCRAERGPLSGLGDDLQLSADQAGALFHGDQAKSRATLPGCFKIETDAVVSDCQLRVTLESARCDGQSARIAMCGGVPGGFLRYSEKTKRRLVADVTQVAFRLESHLNVVMLFNLDTVRFERTGKAEVPERVGVQMV